MRDIAWSDWIGATLTARLEGIARRAGLGGAARGGLATLAGQAFSSAANFLTGVIIARTCTPEEYGLYFLGFSVLVFLLEQQNALLATPYTVFAPRLEGAAHALYTGSVLAHQIVFCAGATMLAVAGALAILLGAGPEAGVPVAWALAAVLSLLLLREFVRRVCFANLQTNWALLIDGVSAVLQVGALLALAALGVLTAALAYLAAGGAAAAVIGVWLRANRAQLRVDAAAVIGDFRRNWTLSKWAAASALVWSVSMNGYPWIITAYQGAGAAGIWAACAGVIALANVLLLGGQNYLAPRIAAVYARSGARGLRPYTLRASLLFGAPMLAVGAGLWVFGDVLLALFYGAGYAGNAPVLAVLALNLCALSLAFVYSRALFAIERADLDFYVNLVPLVVLLTLGIAWVGAHGVIGAAGGLCAANMASLLVRAAAFWYCVGETAKESAP